MKKFMYHGKVRLPVLQSAWLRAFGYDSSADVYFYQSRWGARRFRRSHHIESLSESSLLALLGNRYLRKTDHEALIQAIYVCRDSHHWSHSPFVFSALAKFTDYSLDSAKSLAEFANEEVLRIIAHRADIDDELMLILLRRNKCSVYEELVNNRYLSQTQKVFVSLNAS